MTDRQIEKMLKELLEEIDYDIYKSYFENDTGSDECLDSEPLFEIIRKYVKGSK